MHIHIYPKKENSTCRASVTKGAIALYINDNLEEVINYIQSSDIGGKRDIIIHDNLGGIDKIIKCNINETNHL